VGGHCIPVDPYYLSWKAREFDFYTHFIELAAEVNQSMPYHVVELAGQALGRKGKVLNGARVLVMGVSFKRDIEDSRNSPAERVIELLWKEGAQVSYNDPYVPKYRMGGDVFCPDKVELTSLDLSPEMMAEQDIVIIVSGHRVYDYDWIVEHADLVLDTVNAAKGVSQGRGKIVRIGEPGPSGPQGLCG
jgi:UDP-N-acetyl-D-glucosamine dehydrogenase